MCAPLDLDPLPFALSTVWLANTTSLLLPVSNLTSSTDRLLTLLIGVNAGPLILTWGSLATLLWRERCRAGGLQISWQRFMLSGLLLAPVSVATAVIALHIS